MAYGISYEGDGFIRKGPKPLDVAGKKEERPVEAPRKAAKPAKRGGITPFRFTRMVFGR